jgi:predicted O-methyltransferase YrrM
MGIYEFIDGIRQEYRLRILEENPEPAAQKLVDVLRGFQDADKAAFKPIEDWRWATRRRVEPLVDGSLGEAGPYDEGQTIADACRVSKQPRDAFLLFMFAREFKPRSVIELGTNVGISSAYIAKGLEPGADFATLEASPYRLRLARELHESCRVAVRYSEGLFVDTLPNVLAGMQPIDMAFIDGHDQFRPTLFYFEMILRRAADGCLFIFDDTNWSYEMQKAWRRLRNHPSVCAAVEFRGMGFCIAYPRRAA